MPRPRYERLAGASFSSPARRRSRVASIQPRPLIVPTMGINVMSAMIRSFRGHSGSRNGQTNASVMRSTELLGRRARDLDQQEDQQDQRNQGAHHGRGDA